ncbi:MAG TPA: SIMPL domain-containing protein [Anaerolineales bacterium]|nr:SIMPL domain-containing protein [Anaerolineales bacterium]
MKTKMIFVSLLVLAALGLAACSGTAANANPAEPRTISVNGTGSVTLAPDMAEVNIGVQTEADEADQASAENTQKVNAIMAALEELGIAESDIQTTNFSVWPRQQYNDNNEVQAITYVVQNSLLVTVNDLDLLGDVLDSAIGAGANAINGITFDLSDRDGANAQAMEAAMENAASRAEVLAGAANTEIVEVQSVNAYIGGGGVQRQYAADTDMANEMAAGGSVPVSPGEMEIQVEVSVVYTIN